MGGDGQLGAREPADTRHLEKWPAAHVLGGPRAGFEAERKLRLPSWHATHDQGWGTASCVMHAICLCQAILNGNAVNDMTLRYDPIWGWQQARLRDEFTDNDDLRDYLKGTTYRAAFDVAREVGLVPVKAMKVGRNGIPYAVGSSGVPDRAAGVAANRWLVGSPREVVDQMRWTISHYYPVCFATGWREAWNRFVRKDTHWQWPARSKWGPPGYGHAWVLYGVSDRIGGFIAHDSRMSCSMYPHFVIPYEHMEKILAETWFEACVVTDR